MGNIIKIKRSETSNSVPTTSDLEVGEICMNIADQKLYTRRSDDTIVTVSETITGKPELELISVDTGSSSGPDIDLYRNSFSPFDADAIGEIRFSGENDGNEKVVFSKISTKLLDATDGTEDGAIEIHIMDSGTVSNVATIKSDGIHFASTTGLHFADGTTITTATGLGGEVPTHSHTMLSVDGTVGTTSTTSGAGPSTSIAKIIALG